LDWRLLVPVVFGLAGALFVASAISSGGTDLRAGRYDDLNGLLEAQLATVQRLRVQALDLRGQVDALTASLARKGPVRRAQRSADVLRGPAGLNSVSGPGVTITLNDAPPDIQASSDIDVSELIVHQQDIQAVANALWAGGATAMTIQGQRVVVTTGIKCVGNTVILHDVPYAPPYVLSAVGPVDGMLASVRASKYIQNYLAYVAQYDLGWKLRRRGSLYLPGYTGSTALQYARPVGATP
jgi:uncharacterized protein YlxW (UPF0749 family)